MNIISGIYKITNPEGKVYIGQSSNIDKRWKTYKRLEDVKSQPKLYESLKKYGWENHKWEIIEECNDNNKDNKEKYYISLYDSYNSGLNSSNKSKGPSFHTNKTKEKISKGNKKPKPNSGGKGKPKLRTKEHNYNISISLKGYKQTKEHKENRSKIMKGKSLTSKIVLQYTLDNILIKEWSSAKEACLFYNPKDLNGVSACCLGKQKTAFGFIWKYKEN